MMFWIVLVSLGVLAAWFIILPVLKAKPVEDASRQALNVKIFNQRLQELEEDKAAGRVDDEDYQSLKVELERNFLSDMSHMEGENGLSVGQSQRLLIIGLVIVLPIASLLIYKTTGYRESLPQWFETRKNVDPLIDRLLAGTLKPEDLKQVSMSDFVYGLQRRAQQQADQPRLWFALGNAYLQLQSNNQENQAQFMESGTKALRRAYYLAPENTDYALSYAQALITQNQGALDIESRKILNSVLAKNPDMPAALMMLAMASYQTGDYQAAIDGWEKLLAMGKHTSGYEKAQDILKRSIAQAKVKLEQLSSGETIELKFAIRVGAEVPQVKEGFLMVYAQAEQGPPMPLAIKKMPLPVEFPLNITLTEADAMMPSMTLAQYDKVKVTARITKSGEATPQAGDWVGVIENVSTKASTPGTILINRQL